MDIYDEEYIREQARLAARKDAQPPPSQKNNRPWLTWAVMLPLFIYTVYVLAEVIGIRLSVFMEQDFLGFALALTLLFIWLLRRK
ncbi:MAG: hypothetical protein FH749_12085 [Firmicutes bacterium]|nr:hypothetical protein [Bacillota bacterium]